ncbi:MAG: CDP-diacylglycerol--glycerol-3-phosphate 3-phosphatidyltransferase [Oceanococcaceae bacterium]
MTLTIPTQLTLLRVFAIPVLVLVYFLDIPHNTIIASLIFIAAALTDWLDGYLARRFEQTSAFGAFLDPVADKLIVATALVVLVQQDPRLLVVVPATIIIGREITISALREWMAGLGHSAQVQVQWLGKWKTTFQMTAISLMLWRDPTFGLPVYAVGYALLIIASVLTVWSMVLYLKSAWPNFQNA